MLCPSCGQEELIIYEHPDEDEDDHIGCPRSHPYCRNCDYGLCCGNC